MKKACRLCPQLTWCLVQPDALPFNHDFNSPRMMWVLDKKTVTFTCWNLSPRMAAGVFKDKQYFQAPRKRYESL